MATQNPCIDQYEDHPLYRDILKSILKSQIQTLVNQLSTKIGEETVVLTASLDNGSITDIGTECGLDFIRDNTDIKSQFMGFCMKRYQSRQKENKSISKKSQNNKAIKTPTGQTNKSIKQNPSDGVDEPYSVVNCEVDDKAVEQTIRDESSGNVIVDNDEKNDGTKMRNLGNSKRKALSSPPSYQPKSEQLSESSKSLDIKPSRRKLKPPKRLKTNHADSIDPTTNDDKISSKDTSEEVPLCNDQGLTISTESKLMKNEFGDEDMEDRHPLSGRDKYLWNSNLMHDEQMPGNLKYLGNGEFIIPDSSSSDFDMEQVNEYSAMLNRMKNSEELSNDKTGSSDDCKVEDDLLTSIDTQLKERALLKYDSFDLPYKVSTPSLSKEEVQAMRKSIQNPNTDANGNSPGAVFDKKSPAPASSKNPVCGLLVSRGPGRLEKMLKCEQCGKVCRTSNMARHKKRYCLGYPKVRLSFPQ